MLLGMFYLSTTLLGAQDDYSYSYIPKKVYENQLFPVTIIDTTEYNNNPKFQFETSSDVFPLFKEPLLIHNGNSLFYTFYFKASKNNIYIPRLFIVSDNVDMSLEPQNIPVSQLKNIVNFCSVIATDMKIKSYQISNYDENSHLVIFSIEANEANLEDMRLGSTETFGLEYIKREYAKVKAEFYIVLPASQKILEFNYFNTIKKQYISLQIPTELANTSVVSQSDLHPKEDSFEKLKKYTFIILALFSLFMFLIKKDFFYLVLGAVSFITLLTFYIPHKKICIEQGAPLYILPTQTSTISTNIDQQFETMLLGVRGEFKKVEYKKGIIGWIRDENICKD